MYIYTDIEILFCCICVRSLNRHLASPGICMREGEEAACAVLLKIMEALPSRIFPVFLKFCLAQGLRPRRYVDLDRNVDLSSCGRGTCCCRAPGMLIFEPLRRGLRRRGDICRRGGDAKAASRVLKMGTPLGSDVCPSVAPCHQNTCPF